MSLVAHAKQQMQKHIGNTRFQFCNPATEHLIPYQGGQVKVFSLYEREKSILVDEEGAVYHKTWKRDASSRTPHQRQIKKWNRGEIEYRRYSEGLISLERAIASALLYAEGASDLLMDSYLIADAIGLGLQGTKVTAQDLLSLDMVATLEGLEQLVRHKKNLALGEARGQIRELMLWVRDPEGKPRAAIFRVRWNAMLDRFKDRIASIQAWNIHYLERLSHIVLVRDRFYRMVVRLLSSLQRHYDLACQQPMNNDLKLKLLALCGDYRSELLRWQHLRPFNRWTSAMMRDVRTLEGAIQSDSMRLVRDQFDKMIRSIQFIFLRQEIERVIELMVELEPSVRSGQSVRLPDDGSPQAATIIDGLSKIHQSLQSLDDSFFRKKVLARLRWLWRNQQRRINRSGGSWRKLRFTHPEQFADLRETLKSMAVLL